MDLKTASTFVAICIPFILLTIWAIVDAAQRDFGAMKTKVIWMGIAAIPFIGCFIYFIFGLRKGEKTGSF